MFRHWLNEWLLSVDRRDSSGTASAPTIAPQWLREVFYVHFCVGGAPAEVWARMNSLRANGVGAILNLATHPDHTAGAADGMARARTGNAAAPSPPLRHRQHHLPAQAGTEAAAEAEAQCDRCLDSLLASIDTTAVLPGTGFVAAQLSALCAPGLLETLAAALGRLHSAFGGEADGDGSGGGGDGGDGGGLWASRQSFDRVVGEKLAAAAAVAGSGPDCCDEEPPALSAVQVRQLELLQGRLERLAERAVDKGVKLMFQADEAPQRRPALEHIAHDLMRRYNCQRTTTTDPAAGEAGCEDGGGEGGGGGGAAVFLTYAAHLPDTPQRLQADLERAGREGYRLGAQLVGGPASTSASASLESACLDLLLAAVLSGGAEVMLSSHSRSVVEAAVGAMSRWGLVPEQEQEEAPPVYFGQQLGVADSISFSLGAAGVYKHCPLGDVDNVVPYLVRCIRETQSALQVGGPPGELQLIERELWRRLVQQPVSELGTAAAELIARGSERAGAGASAAARRGAAQAQIARRQQQGQVGRQVNGSM
ncbi:hypothetical protein PLESTF_000318200 [Pleodorina starrii]|nr:hypothetical protein PLESTM_000687900 [Pleodorina starrii]GLC65609.1 hypothetical protein PLESTF_000318200 [Pleodorina starrii]